MKYKTKINGVVILFDDGDNKTSDIMELDGELAEEADNRRLKFMKGRLKSSGDKK